MPAFLSVLSLPPITPHCFDVALCGKVLRSCVNMSCQERSKKGLVSHDWDCVMKPVSLS